MPFQSLSPALILAGLALSDLALAGAVHAADAGDKQIMLDRAFASTIVSTYPDGRQGELWLFRDGAYNAEGRRHDRSSGKWQVKGDKLCMKQGKPVAIPFSFCTAVPAAAALDRPWQSRSVSGEMVSVRLVEGRAGAEKGAEPKNAGADGSRPGGVKG